MSITSRTKENESRCNYNKPIFCGYWLGKDMPYGRPTSAQTICERRDKSIL